MPVTSIADQIFYCTVFISAQAADGRAWTGTGFIIDYRLGGGRTPVLVTNKHVLRDAATAQFRMVAAEGDGPSLRSTQMTVTGFTPDSWVGHPDPAVDVAVLPLAQIVDAMVNNGATPFYRSLGPDMLLTELESNDLEGIEQVTFVGYPSGLFDTRTYLPIARRGYTATPIYNDYRGEPAFLIDASVFPGSSGSPVFLFDQGAYATRSGTVVGLRFKLLGVVAAVHTRVVSGRIEIVPTGAVTSFDEVVDLGIVYKSSAIQACADALFQLRGIDSAGETPNVADLA